MDIEDEQAEYEIREPDEDDLVACEEWEFFEVFDQLGESEEPVPTIVLEQAAEAVRATSGGVDYEGDSEGAQLIVTPKGRAAARRVFAAHRLAQRRTAVPLAALRLHRPRSGLRSGRVGGRRPLRRSARSPGRPSSADDPPEPEPLAVVPQGMAA